jgi:hypothetical protein
VGTEDTEKGKDLREFRTESSDSSTGNEGWVNHKWFLKIYFPLFSALCFLCAHLPRLTPTAAPWSVVRNVGEKCSSVIIQV